MTSAERLRAIARDLENELEGRYLTADSRERISKKIAALLEGAEALERGLEDAARYRFWRDRVDTHSMIRHGKRRPRYAFKRTFATCEYELFDTPEAAIDAARRSERKGPHAD